MFEIRFMFPDSPQTYISNVTVFVDREEKIF